jgi:hypothetical protein
MVLTANLKPATRMVLCLLMLAHLNTALGQNFSKLQARKAQDSQTNSVPVLTISQQIIRTPGSEKICWQSIISDREKAQRERDSLPWIDKYWLPLTGGIIAGTYAVYAVQRFSTSAAYIIMPTILASAAAGFFITQMLIPTPTLLKPAVPGEFLVEQKFYLVQTCGPGSSDFKESAYQVSYMFNGEKQTANLAYDPGERLTLDENGRPLNEIKRK